MLAAKQRQACVDLSYTVRHCEPEARQSRLIYANLVLGGGIT